MRVYAPKFERYPSEGFASLTPISNETALEAPSKEEWKEDPR